MSITIQDLGIAGDIRDVVADVASSILYLISEASQLVNPFNLPTVDAGALVATLPAFAVKQLSGADQTYGLGAVFKANYKVTVGTPEIDNILPGQYFFLDFSNGTQVVSGVVKGVDRQLSSLIQIYLDSTTTLPFTAQSVGVPL